MTRPVPVLALPAQSQFGSQCWICWGPMEEYTDGDGRVHQGCRNCRRKIEAMQRALRGPGSRGGPAVPLRRTWQRSTRRALAVARRVAARSGVPAAARESGLGQGTVWYHARKEGWVVKAIGRGWHR